MDVVKTIHDQEGRKLLDDIDALRALTNVTSQVDLPQVIVCGQQSSGKSSVLRALTNIPFAVQDELCTQFATEVVCRRDQILSTSAKIKPHLIPNAAEQAKLDKFAKTWTKIEGEDGFRRVMEDARKAMGLESHSGYSQDRLILEFSGPAYDHLTIIDLPGLISVSGRDKECVDTLVRSYIQHPQTIILAVVHGPNDKVNQRVFEMIAGYEERTLGVITAPDQVTWDGGRGTRLKELALNKSSDRAEYGWHFVKNLSLEESRNGKDRDAEEARWFAKMADDKAWRGMHSLPCGIDKLRHKLSAVLRERIVTHLPAIRTALDNAARNCKFQINKLGEERQTPSQQREYLKDVASKLEDDLKESLKGQPGIWSKGTIAKSLRDKIRNANQLFADDVRLNGRTWEEVQTGLATATPGMLSDEAFYQPNTQRLAVSRDMLADYIAAEIRDNPGLSLPGTFDPAWLGRFFLQQSAKWADMVDSHANTVSDTVEEHLRETINIYATKEISDKCFEIIIAPKLKERRDKLLDKAGELLTPFRTVNLMTLNNAYEQSVRESERSTSILLKDKRDETTLQRKLGLHVLECVNHFYNIALNILLDNVACLGVENVLLKELNKILDAVSVAEMDEQEIAILAAEDEATAVERNSLRQQLQDLEKGRTVIARHLLRNKSTTLVSRGTKSTAFTSTSRPVPSINLQDTEPVNNPYFPEVPSLTPDKGTARSTATNASGIQEDKGEASGSEHENYHDLPKTPASYQRPGRRTLSSSRQSTKASRKSTATGAAGGVEGADEEVNQLKFANSGSPFGSSGGFGGFGGGGGGGGGGRATLPGSFGNLFGSNVNPVNDPNDSDL